MRSVKILAYLLWMYILGVKYVSTWNLNYTSIPFPLKAIGNRAACILPQHPSSGSWSLIDETSNLSPGTLVTHRTYLQISCRETYTLDGANFTACINGEWSNGIGQCLKTCEPLHSTSKMTVVCTFNEKKLKDCVHALDGTIARFKCATFYEERGLGIRPAYCLKGKWSSDPPECVPVCGRKSVNEDPALIVKGTVVKKGDYPWQVALYTIHDKVLQCGGSLLNERIILTAAHCITDDKGKLLPKESYVVAVGKYYREYNDIRDFNETQFSKIHDMLIPRQYKGSIQHYFGDIAMIVAKKTFTLSQRVQPVCVDWESKYENSLFLNPSRLQKGYVTGWGYTVEHKDPSDVLKELSVPLIDYDQCTVNLAEKYEEHMTDDKLCAGYLSNGTSVCKGDSGGGLVFKYGKRYYLVGIVSVAPQAPTNVGGCNSQLYGLYTQVSYYMDKFILHNEARYKYLISEDEDCIDGACENATIELKASSAPITNRSRFSEEHHFLSCNGHHTFSCKSGSCIGIEQQCDGRVDCPDGSDENDCQKIRCPGYFFRCQYGACINAELECDGKMDCRDGSDEDTSKCRSSSACNNHQFRCNSGQCIETIFMCDGKAQCDDNSDEIKETCSKVRCSRYNFRCKYGACLEISTECNGIVDCFDGSDEDSILCKNRTPKTEDCLLPGHPSFGQWSIYGTPVGTFAPNMSVSYGTILKIECQKQYFLNGTESVVCETGSWKPSIGRCLKKCPSIVTTESMKVTCINGGKQRENCTNAIEGTLARFKCAPFYEDLGLKRYPLRMCRDGTWDRKPPECAPACGLMAPEPTTLGIDREKMKIYPWEVAIYTKMNQESIKMRRCIGSLINQRVVLSAAHCVAKEGRPQSKNKFSLAVGKQYKMYNDARDHDAQFSEVEQIFIHAQYRGHLHYYMGDIAILVAKRSFTLSHQVLPVCVDWDANYETELLENNNTPAYLVTANSSYSSRAAFGELKEKETEQIDRETCMGDIPGELQVFLTYDKFCGSMRNDEYIFAGTGTSVKKHDDSDRYYITGIENISFEDTVKSRIYIFFTNVTKYLDFILEKEVLFRPSASYLEEDYTGNIPPVTPQPEIQQRGCTLPPDPDFGSWSIFESRSTALPGTMVNPGTILSVACRKGYQLDGMQYIFCYNNKWSPELGKCLNTCPPLSNTTTTKVTCFFKNKLTKCGSPADGTIAKFKCVDYYENPLLTQQYYENNQDLHVCLNGTWSQPEIRCQSMCGKKSITNRPVPNQIHIDTVEGDYPWQVAIRSDTQNKYVCSGSLINPRVILTAAQCVTTENGTVKSEEFIITAGECWKEYSRDRPFFRYAEIRRKVLLGVCSSVIHIFIPNEYKGATSNYVSDIAVLITATPFKLSDTVQPVCVDWQGLYKNKLNTNTTITGYTAGWGFTENNTKLSGKLKELSLPIVSQEKCKADLPQNVRNFVTNDKLCADYLNDTSLCQHKNSKGGGLVLQHDGRYYITGVLSMASDDTNCENQLYGLYTKVSQYVDSFIIPHELQFRP